MTLSELLLTTVGIMIGLSFYIAPIIFLFYKFRKHK